ncbi:MAG: DUF3298 domain-containing protein [Bacteroides sp.]|nr:DUF3298 domain-containing protein [Bacteroides sp.]
MKKIFGIMLAVSLVMGSACSKSGKQTQAAPDTMEVTEVLPEFTTDSVAWSDSLTLGRCSARIAIVGRYPSPGVGGALADSVRRWIGNRLAYSDIFGNKELFAVDNQVLADGNSLAAVAGGCLRSIAEGDFKEFMQDSTLSVNYEFYLRFVPSFESDSLLTYTFLTYGDMGGAHGGSVALSQTFDRNTGQALTYANAFVPERRAELIELVKKELWEQYFKADFANSTEGGDGAPTLRDALLINPDTMQLPVCPPDFRQDGVVFLYQQYEIACYAAGMPACLIPYEELQPMLDPRIKPLLPRRQ